jgi:acetolactate synthase-1/2/3 large subunit
VDRVAAMLRKGGATTILLGGSALHAEGLGIAHRIAAATGARLLAPTQVARMARGRGRPAVDRLPFSVDASVRMLAETRQLILAGARAPVGFFGYPGKPSELWPKECQVVALAEPGEDVLHALATLADSLDARKDAPIPPLAQSPRPGGRFTPEGFGHALAAVLPDDAVVVEDAVTSGRGIFPLTFSAAPHDWLQITGGSIGFAFPAATGAAVGAPGRKVVCLQADGGGMYSLQSLWTQARERLDVVNVVFNNKRYAILQGELANVGAKPGPASNELFDLSRPELDWVGLAKGMGVEAVRAEDLGTFMDIFAAACKRPGPFLIEMMA